MARTKPKAMAPVKDLAGADAALKEMAELTRSIDAINNRMNGDIDKIKDRAAREAAPIRERLTALENGLDAFAEFNKEELFNGKRSLELTFGKIGFRASTRLKPDSRITWAEVLGILKQQGLTEAINTKESVDKEELKKWPNERLATICVHRDPRDVFWYELKQEDLAEDEGRKEAA